ncbi:MAG: Atu2307/SP_0267 family LLM class monooxygenase [Chitinophagales bacterium]
MEFGICSFADTGIDSATGKRINAHQRLKELIEEIELVDQLGFDVFALGEHHRIDYAASAPAIILAAAAARTKKVKLSTAVTVLSTDDPVRVFQQFATIDLLSEGRAEIMAGRGSFTESYPLFGYDLHDYDELFEEKLNLLLQLNKSEKITWKGQYRTPLNNAGIYPRPYQKEIPIWIAIGGTPESAMRAGRLGLPLTLAIIGGYPKSFAPIMELYRNTAKENGNEEKIKVGINTHVYVAETSQQAADEFAPPYLQVMNMIGKERGWSGMTREQFDMMRTPQASLMVGSPQQVIDKMLYEYELFRYDRFLAQMSIGALPHKQLMKAIELFATKVVPEIRKAVQ